MERQLFSWQGWDEKHKGSFTLIFTGVKLIKQIGLLSVGEKFDEAVVDFDAGKLELTIFEPNSKDRVVKERHEFDLKLEIQQ